MLKKVISDENGRALALTLVILGIGVLLIPVLLSHASTNLFANRAIEEGLKEQYAADSGIEYALWQLQTGVFSGTADYGVNNKDVEVAWTEYISPTYVITSTAGSTTIISYVSLNMSNYLWLLDNAITSLTDITLMPGTYVSGTVEYGRELDNKGRIEPEEPEGPTEGLDDKWPAAEDMAKYFFADVEGLTPYPYDSIDLKDTNTIGPLFRDGDLHIDNTGSSTTATLEGTIYVRGELDFEQPGGSKAYTIDLNGQTIYVEKAAPNKGDISFPAQLVTITGSGCIIADGFVNFQPGISSSSDDFVFVMSVTEYVWMKPQGDFYGSIAGNAYVDLQPGCSLTWTDWEGRDLNYPDGTTGRAQIHTYKVYP